MTWVTTAPSKAALLSPFAARRTISLFHKLKDCCSTGDRVFWRSLLTNLGFTLPQPSSLHPPMVRLMPGGGYNIVLIKLESTRFMDSFLCLTVQMKVERVQGKRRDTLDQLSVMKVEVHFHCCCPIHMCIVSSSSVVPVYILLEETLLKGKFENVICK